MRCFGLVTGFLAHGYADSIPMIMSSSDSSVPNISGITKTDKIKSRYRDAP